jgi:hypothetical protein
MAYVATRLQQHGAGAATAATIALLCGAGTPLLFRACDYRGVAVLVTLAGYAWVGVALAAGESAGRGGQRPALPCGLSLYDGTSGPRQQSKAPVEQQRRGKRARGPAEPAISSRGLRDSRHEMLRRSNECSWLQPLTGFRYPAPIAPAVALLHPGRSVTDRDRLRTFQRYRAGARHPSAPSIGLRADYLAQFGAPEGWVRSAEMIPFAGLAWALYQACRIGAVAFSEAPPRLSSIVSSKSK